MLGESALATIAALSVTASFPFYLVGAWIILDSEVVTWSVLTRHLSFIVVGLVLTTVPVVTWMGPRLLQQLGGLSALHAVLGLQAYALLAFGLTGIVRIVLVKRRHNLYAEPDADVALDDLHENMSAWRGRLRIGVFGYVLFWLAAYLLGIYRYLVIYVV